MTTTDFRAAVKTLYARACAGEAVQEFTALMEQRRHHRLCECGCGKALVLKRSRRFWLEAHGRGPRFATLACFRRWKFPVAKGIAALLLAVTALAQPPLPIINPRSGEGMPVRPFTAIDPQTAWQSPPCTIKAVTLSWEPVPDAAGYRVYWGWGESQYTNRVDVGTSLTATVELCYAWPAHFAVTAYDATGQEGWLSEDLVLRPPPQTNWVEVGVVLSEAPTANGPWTERTNLTPIRFLRPTGAAFWWARPTIRQGIEN